jgi:AcrR family transcriptional regulator
VAIPDVRERLFDAAERVVLRDGPSALTSRAVTTEAGCAKGVLHRHFDDMDDFLAALVEDRAGRLAEQDAALTARAGTGTVADTLTEALGEVFGSLAVAIVGLITARDGLRVRLRRRWPDSVPLLADATGVLARYLAAEQDRGRLAAGADARDLALMLVGTGHLLFAGRDGEPPDAEAVRAVVTMVLAGAAA